jgi:4-hydroxy-3-methylbut-2-en-1-yl diphosphate reductase
VAAVLARLAPVHGVEEVPLTAEDEYFPPPRELRELLAALDVVAGATLAAPGTAPTASDREVAASDVLAALAR